MKKLIVTVLCLMTVLSLFACVQKIKYSDSVVTEVDTYPNVSMELFDEDINLNLMTLKVVNNNDFGIESSNMNDFWVEEYRDGKWQVIVVEEKDNTAEARVFNGQQLLQIDVSSVYGELPKGHYRILKWFTTRKPNEIGTFYLSTEFDIK
jgi:hypothetical protein